MCFKVIMITYPIVHGPPPVSKQGKEEQLKKAVPLMKSASLYRHAGNSHGTGGRQGTNF